MNRQRRRRLYRSFIAFLPAGPLLAKLDQLNRADVYYSGYQAGYRAAMEHQQKHAAQAPIFFDSPQPK